MAEREGFEPSVPLFGSTRDFQSRSFGQLGHLSEITDHPGQIYFMIIKWLEITYFIKAQILTFSGERDKDKTKGTSTPVQRFLFSMVVALKQIVPQRLAKPRWLKIVSNKVAK